VETPSQRLPVQFAQAAMPAVAPLLAQDPAPSRMFIGGEMPKMSGGVLALKKRFI
jgi:hypothetical protein